MTARPAIPRPVLLSLKPAVAKCYRHCELPVRAHRFASPLRGIFDVYACPSGVVSLSSYVEWSASDRTSKVRDYLRSRTFPPSLVHVRDLRIATRHGPELGRSAEKVLAGSRPPRPVRVVYWRVYPFQGRDSAERRLFVCRRHGLRAPVFFSARSRGGDVVCPKCAGADPRAARRPGLAG
jgi:hypothetical protein